MDFTARAVAREAAERCSGANGSSVFVNVVAGISPGAAFTLLPLGCLRNSALLPAEKNLRRVGDKVLYVRKTD